MGFNYSKRKFTCLQAIGIEFYVRRDGLSSAQELTPKPKPLNDIDVKPMTTTTTTTIEHYKDLCQEMKQCTACVLHETRTQVVPGVGDINADWMFVGEAPGADEDKKGEPFVGRAGKLLDKMLKAIGFERSEVYIANVVKCRPPDNRNPRPEEIESCNSFLKRQIQLVKPKVIITLGKIATDALLGGDFPIGKLRGQQHSYKLNDSVDIPLFVTYHPAYLLRSPTKKVEVWKDLQYICSAMGRALP